MNNPNLTIILGWNTRSEKRHTQAVEKCKDFGFKRVLKNIYIGKLQITDRRSIVYGLNKIFNKKTDEMFLTTICQSCFQSLDPATRELLPELPDFRIID